MTNFLKLYMIPCCMLWFIQLSLAQNTQLTKNENSQCNYLDINGISVHYRIYGEGTPLLLLHGNRASSEFFASNIPELSKYFKVIIVDSRAQGKTTDSDTIITYELMASDMAELIRKLKLGKVDIVGHSDGANIGLELAKAAPHLINKLVMFAGNYKIDTTVISVEWIPY